MSYFSASASTKIWAGLRIKELRGDPPLRLPLLSGPLFFANCTEEGCTAGCTVGVSALSIGDCIISSPRRNVIISRKKQATAEAAEPFSFELSKRLEVASPATCAASAIGSDVFAA